ncbi:MAG: hypothetical protein NTW19_17435 [Planctomycetota bacterium]|nr:hypothetical protein [Planctomycetota bacterium]
MKAIVAILVLVALVGGGLYFMGLFSMPSPEEDEKKIKALVAAGGSWETLTDVSPPRIYRSISHSSMTGRGAEQKFDRAAFGDLVKRKGSSEGYALEYHLSADIAFEVMVDSSGKLTEIEEMRTMKSLMTPGAP